MFLLPSEYHKVNRNPSFKFGIPLTIFSFISSTHTSWIVAVNLERTKDTNWLLLTSSNGRWTWPFLVQFHGYCSSVVVFSRLAGVRSLSGNCASRPRGSDHKERCEKKFACRTFGHKWIMKCEIMYGRKESTIWFGNINVTYRYLFANKYINIVCFPPGVQYNFEKKKSGRRPYPNFSVFSGCICYCTQGFE